MIKRSTTTPHRLVRYPYSSLGVSYIAEQSYCEKRVDLWLDNPGALVSVPAQAEKDDPRIIQQETMADSGTDFHESVSNNAEELSWEEIRNLLRSGNELTLVESRLEGKYRSVPLLGRPDAICFDGMNVACVLEYKITKSNQLYMSHRVQLLLYGYLLEQQKFRVDNLVLVCVLVPPRHRDYFQESSKSEIQHFVHSIREKSEELVTSQPTRLNWQHFGFSVNRTLKVKLRIFRYNREKAKSELDFFINYWLGKRDAIPTTNPEKCKVCLYNAFSLCPVAQTAYRRIQS